jgi:hypothetical protein
MKAKKRLPAATTIFEKDLRKALTSTENPAFTNLFSMADKGYRAERHRLMRDATKQTAHRAPSALSHQ